MTDPHPTCRATDEAYCPRCGEPDPEPSVEAFETLGEVMCGDCFEAVIGDDGQPDEATEWSDYDRDC